MIDEWVVVFCWESPAIIKFAVRSFQKLALASRGKTSKGKLLWASLNAIRWLLHQDNYLPHKFLLKALTIPDITLTRVAKMLLLLMTSYYKFYKSKTPSGKCIFITFLSGFAVFLTTAFPSSSMYEKVNRKGWIKEHVCKVCACLHMYYTLVSLVCFAV